MPAGSDVVIPKPITSGATDKPSAGITGDGTPLSTGQSTDQLTHWAKAPDLTLKQFVSAVKRKFPKEAAAYHTLDDWHFAEKFISGDPKNNVYKERIKDWPGSPGDPNLLQASAPKDPRDLGEFISRSANNLTMDLIHGTTSSIAGRLFKAMGGKPLGETNQGHILASIPLGVLQIANGIGQSITASNPTIGIDPKLSMEGTKNILGGGLKTSELPLAFMAPEEGELAAKGATKAVDKTVGSVTKGVKQVRQYLNPKSATIPNTGALRELKVGELVQKIVSDNIAESGHKLVDASKEVENINDLIRLTKGRLRPDDYGKLEVLYKAKNEAVEVLGDAQELNHAMTKFGNKIAGSNSPEKLIVDLINGGKGNQSLTKNVLMHLEDKPRAVKHLQDSVMRGIVEKYTDQSLALGKRVNWIKVQNDLMHKGDMAKELYGSRYYPILKEVNKMAQDQRKGKAIIYSAGAISILGLGNMWLLRNTVRALVQ